MLCAPPAAAACSLKSLAGRWMFATGVGHQAEFPNAGDISAIGVFSLDRAGKLSGKFDATLQNLSFLSDVKFDGTITLSADCTGVLTFSTARGNTRFDSIVVVSSREILGMSRDPRYLWTYQMRRL